MTPRPFTISVPDEVLADLRERLARVRWPDEAPGAGWEYGTDLAYLQELVAYWRDRYDWRAHEARAQRVPQFTAPRRRASTCTSSTSRAWARTRCRCCSPTAGRARSWEFQKIIPMLTDPGALRRRPRRRLHGRGALAARLRRSRSARASRASASPRSPTLFAALMTDVLGYRRFGAQGGDWGAFITVAPRRRPSRAPRRHPPEPARRCAATSRRRPSADRRGAARTSSELGHWLREETGYQGIQGTKPQTLAYGLTDSPVGLAAWIVEKFRTWSDCDGDVERRFTQGRAADQRHALLGHRRHRLVVLALLRAAATRRWPHPATAQRVEVPTGYAAFPREILRPPRAWAERVFNIRRWTAMPAGGHFAALEEPEALAADIRAFFRALR